MLVLWGVNRIKSTRWFFVTFLGWWKRDLFKGESWPPTRKFGPFESPGILADRRLVHETKRINATSRYRTEALCVDFSIRFFQTHWEKSKWCSKKRSLPSSFGGSNKIPTQTQNKKHIVFGVFFGPATINLGFFPCFFTFTPGVFHHCYQGAHLFIQLIHAIQMFTTSTVLSMLDPGFQLVGANNPEPNTPPWQFNRYNSWKMVGLEDYFPIAKVNCSGANC